jgi:hypothetical protein
MKISRLLVIVAAAVLALNANARPGYCEDRTDKPADADREIAARFAPIFYQALGDRPRSDYITNFDFDGDWRGDNNWENGGNESIPLNAYIYYSVAETSTHYFIQYAVFHPRDYKGGEVRGAILSELIREGVKRGGKYDPTGLADEATLAHENDMEGALVTVEKKGKNLDHAQVRFVETLHHNTYSHYAAAGVEQETFSAISLEEQHPVLYIEPKGHGIEAFTGVARQVANKEFLRYIFTGRAADPARLDANCRDLAATPCKASVGYDLISLKVLWDRARNKDEKVYGVTNDYGKIAIALSLKDKTPTTKTIDIGKIGSAFLGKVGGENMARPPWGWFSMERTNDLPGSSFFDPAASVKRDYGLNDSFSVAYVRLPFWAE